MANLALNVEIPEGKIFDTSTLQEQLNAFVKILVMGLPSKQTKQEEDMHIFDRFDGNWGGEKDSHEIAEELYNTRGNSRPVESW